MARGSSGNCSNSSSSSSSSRNREEIGEQRSIMACLADDTLLEVLRHLPTRYLLHAVALVCRRWRRLCESRLVYELVPPLWTPTYNPWGDMTEGRILKLAKQHASTLVTIQLHGLKQLNGKALEETCMELPHLHHLEVVSCPQVTVADYSRISKNLPSHLSTLVLLNLPQNGIVSNTSDISSCDDFIETLQKHYQSLQKLALDIFGSPGALDGLLQACHGLVSLNLNSNTLGWHHVGCIFQSCLSLCELSLISALLDNNDEQDTIPMNKTKVFNSNSLSETIPNSLVLLRLYKSTKQSVAWESEPGVHLLRARGQQLQQLHAHGLFNSSWYIIHTLCFNLKCLDLSHSNAQTYVLTKLEESAIVRLVQQLKKLEDLALPAATDRILFELGVHCPHLSKFFFQGHGPRLQLPAQSQVTDFGVSSLAQGCPKLHVLSLEGCDKVTITSARYVTSSFLPIFIL
ncbi:hypothetical protein BDL97_08G102800 [Sphagnum fallax]|nr:hypothetical protein BDL97_08G102800 [Sphagnum fallax]